MHDRVRALWSSVSWKDSHVSNFSFKVGTKEPVREWRRTGVIKVNP